MNLVPGAVAAMVAIIGFSPALAQDMRASDGSQFYVGIFGGGGPGYVDDTYPTLPLGELDGPLSGLLGGIFMGAEITMENGIVMGVEADAFASTIGGTTTNETFSADSFETSVNWGGSLRARLGYRMDATTIYVTGGLAAASVTGDYLVLGSSIYGPETNTVFGHTIGGGIEHEFDDGWFGRGEYRFTSYQPSTYGNGSALGDPFIQVSTHSLTAGIGKKLN